MQKCPDRNHAKKLFNKLLDRRHIKSKRRFCEVVAVLEVMENSRKFYDVDDIPEPFWAAMRHPLLNREAGVWIYGNSHTLSHLVGRSNRADLSSHHHLRQDMAAAEEKSVGDVWWYREKLIERDNNILSRKAQDSLSAYTELWPEISNEVVSRNVYFT